LENGILVWTQKLNRRLIFWPRIPQLPLVAAVQLLCPGQYSSRLKIPEAEHGKPCNAGRLREAEGCRPYRLRYKVLFWDVAVLPAMRLTA